MDHGQLSLALKLIVDTANLENDVLRQIKAVKLEPIKIDLKVESKSLKSDLTQIQRQIEQMAKTQNGGWNIGKPIADGSAELERMGQYYARLEKQSKAFGETQKKMWTQIPIKEHMNAITQTSDEVKKLNQHYRELSKSTLAEEFLNLDKFKLDNRMQAWMNDNSKAVQMFGSQVSDLRVRLQDADSVEFRKITKEFQGLQAEAKALGVTGKSAFDELTDSAQRFANWLMAGGAVMLAWRGIKQMIDEVIQLDASLVELNKVTDFTGDGLERFAKRAFDAAEGIGRTGREVIDATSEFRRAGYELESSFDMAQAALVMTNVGDGIDDVSQAASSLIAVLRGYNIGESEIMTVVDRINEVSNTAPVTFANLTEGLERVSGTLAQTGTTLDQTIGLLTGGFAQLRNMEKVSSGLIMISQRLRGVAEDGEEIEGLAVKMQESFQSIAGIDIEIDGQLRSTYDILRDLSEVWDTLTSKQKQYLGELAAGNRQITVLNAMMGQWQDVEKAVDSATNSMGSAMKENEVFLDSIQGKLNVFSSTFQTLSQNIVGSDLLKMGVDAGTGVLGFINALIERFGVLPTAIAGVVAAFTALNKASALNPFGMVNKDAEGLIKTLGFLGKSFQQISADFSSAKGFDKVKSIFASVKDEAAEITQILSTNDAAGYIKEYETAFRSGADATVSFIDSLDNQHLQNYFNSLEDGNATVQNYTTYTSQVVAAQNAQTMSAKATALAQKALAVAINVGLSLAVAAAIKGITTLIQRQEEMRQSALQAAEAFGREKDAIDGYKDKIQELKTSLESGNLSHEEAYEKRKELIGIQDEIIQKYGAEAQAIDLLNGSLESQLGILDDLVRKRAEEDRAANKKAYDKAEKKMEQAKDYSSVVPYGIFGQQEILDVIAQFRDRGVYFDDNGDGRLTLHFEGDARNAKAAMVDLSTELEALKKQAPDTSIKIIDQVQKNIAGNISSVNKVIEKYGELYNDFQYKKIITDTSSNGDGSKNLSQLWEDATRALQGYNEALAASDADQLKQSLDALLAARDAALAGAGDDTGVAEYFSNMFASVEKELAAHTFTVDLEANQDHLADSVKSALDGLSDLDNLAILNLGTIEGTEEQKAAFAELTELADQYSLSIESLIDILTELGCVQGVPVAETFDVLTEKFGVFASALSDLESSSFLGNALYERLAQAKEQFEEGTISVQDYFGALNDEIRNIDFSNFTDSLEEVSSLQAAFFSANVQEAAQGLSDLIGRFEDGAASVSEYLDGFTAIGEMVGSLTSMLQENGDAWVENGAIAADSLESVQDTLAQSIATIDSYKDSIYSVSQILQKVVKEGSDEFTAHTQVIAADLMHIVETSGIMADEVKARLGSTTEEIAQSLTESVSNQQLAAQAIAANTNTAIAEMAESVGTLFEELGNAISNFKVEMTFGVKSIQWGSVDILGKEFPIPQIEFALEASGSTQTALQSIGAAVSGFGNNLKDHIQSTQIQLEDFYKVASDSYNPSPAAIDNYTKALDNLKESAKSAANEMVSAFKDATAAINNLISMTMSMIKQGYTDQINGLKKDLSSLTKDYQSSKSAMTSSHNAAKKRLDSEKKALQQQNKERQKAYNDAIKAENDLYKQQQKRHNDAKKAIQDELAAYRKRIELQLEALRLKEKERSYQKELKQKQKNVADLEAQLLQIQFDTSEAGNKKRRELEEQLAQKREELEEFQHDRSIELQEDALNQALKEFQDCQDEKLAALEREWARQTEEHERRLEQIKAEYESWQSYYDDEMQRLDAKAERLSAQHQANMQALEDEYQTNKAKLEKEIEDLQEKANDEVEIRKEAIRLIEERSEEFYDNLLEWNRRHGTSVDADVKEAWRRAYEVLEIFNEKEIDVQKTLELLVSEMYRLESATQAATRAMQQLAAASKSVNTSAASSGGGGASKTGGAGRRDVLHDGGKVADSSPRQRAIVGGDVFLKPNEKQVIVENGETILPNSNPNRAARLMAEYIDEKHIPLNAVLGSLTGSVSATSSKAVLPNIAKQGVGKVEGSSYGNIDTSVHLTVQGNADDSTLPKIRKELEDYEDRVISQVFSKLIEGKRKYGGFNNLKLQTV